MTNIYGLVSPIDGQIVYVGCTTNDIDFRLNQHYWHLKAALRGERRMNKRFVYLNDLLPLKVSIKLLYSFDETKSILNAKFYEEAYIAKYRKINPNLLNETDGGYGGNTHRYKTKEEISIIGDKISNKLKGKSKPKGFAEHLSEIRKGLGNPGVKKLDNPVYAYNVYSKLLIKKPFNYGFEINNFLHRKNAWSNVAKVINKKPTASYCKNKYRSCFGFYWLTYEYAKEYMK